MSFKKKHGTSIFRVANQRIHQINPTGVECVIVEDTHTHTHVRKPHERDSVVQELHHPYSQSFECWQSEEGAWFNTTDHVTPQVPVEAKFRILGREQFYQQQNTTLIPKRNWYPAQNMKQRGIKC